MSLRRKASIAVAITTGCLVTGLLIILMTFVKSRVEKTEESELGTRIGKVSHEIDDMLNTMSVLNKDWASWDDSYEFVENLNEDYKESNLNTETICKLGLNDILYFNTSGDLIFSATVDPLENRTAILSGELIDYIHNNEYIWDFPDSSNGFTCMGLLESGPVLISSEPILTSKGEGPSRGALIMVRNIEDDEIADFSRLSGLSLTVTDRPASLPNPNSIVKGKDNSPTKLISLERTNNKILTAYVSFEDTQGNPVMLLKVKMYRTEYLHAFSDISKLILFLIIIGFVFGSVMLILLDRLILQRLSNLISEISEVSKSGNIRNRIVDLGDDELGKLSGELNKMLVSLENSETQRRTTLEQFEILFKTMGEGLIIVDDDEKITFANPAACDIFNMQSDLLIGSSLSNFIKYENLQIVNSGWEMCRLGKKASFETEIVRPNLERRSILVTATPRFDEDGKFTGALKVIRDITERKLSEKMKAALEVKGEFLSMVSHELRTPLVPIMGFSELMLDGTFGQLSDEQKEPVRTILQRANSLKKLIDDLLNISATDRGNVLINTEPIAIREFISGVISPYQNINLKIPVRLTYEGDDFMVLADPHRLRQVIENLIGNAIKYSETTAEITIRTAVDENMGIISVIDKGIGISGEHLPYIFDRFYQAEPINTRKHEGSGLGLAIAKDLVEQMDGIITAESVIGVGSCFTVSLPLADEYFDHAVSPSKIIADINARADEIQKPVSELRSQNILLVDDDPMIADIVKMMLGGSFKLHPAQTGNIGMDILRTHHIDLVLLDWMIPGIDGLSFLVAMKTDERFANIPVIFLSAKAESEIIRMGLEAGADGFVTKPFKKEELLRTMAEAIGAKRN